MYQRRGAPRRNGGKGGETVKSRTVLLMMLVVSAGVILLPRVSAQEQETSEAQAESHKIWPREGQQETPLFTINAGATALVVRGPGNEWLKILPGEVLEVGQSSLSAQSCSVTCRESKYACCKPPDECKCRDTATDDTDCMSGGKDASACSISSSS